MSEDECRRKWKGLRDTYLRDRRKEAGERSGSAAVPFKKWRYSAVFPRPICYSLGTSSNMGLGVEDDRTAEDLVRTRVQRQQQGQRVT